MEKQFSVITGASKGIGKAIAVKLAAEGHNLALFGRDKEALKNVETICKKTDNEVLTFSGDVANAHFVNDSLNQILLQFDKVDNLINNAGVGIFKKFIDTHLNEFKEQMNTNIYGVFNFTKAVLPSMIERKTGVIINISSLAGKNPFVYGTTYGATKHALMGFTKSLMLEVREYNIKVAAVCPGSVNTEMLTDTVIKPKDINYVLSPDDVAETVSLIIKMPPNALISEIDIRPTNPK